MTRHTRSEWAAIIQRWRTSALPARDFAEREGLNLGTLRWWSSQLPRQSPPSNFVEVRLSEAASAAITVVLRDGLRIEVSDPFDADLLRRVLTALESR